MCKVSKTGAGACIHFGWGSKDVTTQVTEEVKLLVVLSVGLPAADDWRLEETTDLIVNRPALQEVVRVHLH